LAYFFSVTMYIIIIFYCPLVIISSKVPVNISSSHKTTIKNNNFSYSVGK
jgi:hypothetical protein